MKIGIQILNYNGLDWLEGLLASLRKSKLGGSIVYIVDNASDDLSLEYVEKHYPDVVIIKNAFNLGYAAAYNQSIPKAFKDGCDWVCLLNTDTLVTANWLDSIRSAAELDASIGIIGPAFVDWASDEPSDFLKDRYPNVVPYINDVDHGPVDVDWVEGSVFFIKKECFEHIGGLDEIYFMYWEEADFCRRAQYCGWRVVIASGSVCKHYSGGSTVSCKLNFLKIRNHFYYKLSDPFNRFGVNTLSALRLFMTYVKECVWHKPNFQNLIILLKALLSTAITIGKGYNSWLKNTRRRPRYELASRS